MARPKINTRVFISVAVVLTVVTMALAAIGIGPRFTEITGVDSIVISAADLKRGDLRFLIATMSAKRSALSLAATNRAR
jgi:hypothetical protein